MRDTYTNSIINVFFVILSRKWIVSNDIYVVKTVENVFTFCGHER